MDVGPNVLVVACSVSYLISDLVFTYQFVSQVALDELFLNPELLTAHYLRRSTPGPGGFAFYFVYFEFNISF